MKFGNNNQALVFKDKVYNYPDYINTFHEFIEPEWEFPGAKNKKRQRNQDSQGTDDDEMEMDDATRKQSKLQAFDPFGQKESLYRPL